MVQRKKKNQKRKGEQDYEKDDGNENEQGDGSKGSKTDPGSSRYDSFDDNDGILRAPPERRQHFQRKATRTT